jgi:hypothetical protein
MEERHERVPAGAEDCEKRRRRDHGGGALVAPGPALQVPGRRPAPEIRSEHEPRLALLQDEGAVRQLGDRRLVKAPLIRSRIETLGVELGVDRVGSDLARMQVAPDREQLVIVLAAALRTGAMAGGERRHLVEEEELGVAARLDERTSPSSAELEPARNPPLDRVAAANATLGVVEAAAIAVDEAAGGIGDQVAKRRNPVLEGAQTWPSYVSRR